MERRRDLTRPGQMDFALLVAVIMICAFGLVMVFSASYYYAQNRFSDGFYYLRNQTVFFALGIVSMLVLSKIDYHLWERFRVVFLIVTMLLMAAVVFFGVSRNGAKRWLSVFGLFTFQPSELGKFALVLYMSSFMAKYPQRMRSFTHGMVPMLIVTGAMCLLVLIQKNMSMMVIILFTGILMMFIGGAQLKHLVLLGLSAIPLLFLLAWIEPYRWERLMMFRDPWKDPLDSGYQLIQSLYALGSGGLFGQGLNFSRQKLLFLTYGESDFIFSIIGEELGFVGCVGVICAYMFIIYRGIRIALMCKDRFGSLLAAGIVCVMGMQAAVNIGVASSAIPTTGQTLPFISAGGTSLLIFLSAFGILLNISRNTGPQI